MAAYQINSIQGRYWAQSIIGLATAPRLEDGIVDFAVVADVWWGWFGTAASDTLNGDTCSRSSIYGTIKYLGSRRGEGRSVGSRASGSTSVCRND